MKKIHYYSELFTSLLGPDVLLGVPAVDQVRLGGAQAAPAPRRGNQRVDALVERFDIEPYSDFSAK